MAKLLVNFAQARDHLKVGMSVTVRTGEKKPPKADVLRTNLWNAHNYTGTVVALTADGMDVEVEKPEALLVNHFDASHIGLFEVDAALVDDEPELRRRAKASALSQEELVTALMNEIEELRSRVVLLELFVDSQSR